MSLPYTFANAIGPIPLSQLDSNFNAVEAFANTAGVVTEGAQPNITSVGVLNSLSVVGHVSAATYSGNGRNLTGIVANTSYDNSNVAAFLPTYTGNLTANNIIVAGVVTGNGAGLSGINGPNVVSAVSNAAFASSANVVVVNAQPNITSVGTLTSLLVSGNILSGNLLSANISTPGNISATGNVSATYFIGNGSQLTGISAGGVTNANQLQGNTLSSNVVFSSLTTVGTLTSLSVAGAVIPGSLSTAGNVSAAGMTAGGNITSGNLSASGGVTATTLTGTLTTASQHNITSLGTLTSLDVSGNVGITGNLNPTNIVSPGNLDIAGWIDTGGGIVAANVSSDTDIVAVGNITGNFFIGNGSQLTGIDTGIQTTIQSGNASFLCDSVGQSNIFAYFGNGGFARFGQSPSDPNSYGFYSTGFVSTDGLFQANLARITGIQVDNNITVGANVVANGVMRANTIRGNISILSSGNITAVDYVTGNVIHGNLLISTAGNVVAGNLVSGNNLATLSNVQRVLYVANTSPGPSDGAVGDIWYQTY